MSWAMRLGILLTLVLYGWASASHHPDLAWMAGYYGQGPCCGDLDCVEATVAVLAERDGETTVLIGEHEITIPSHWVHQTKDGRGHYCFVPEQPLATYTDANGITRAVPPEVPTRKNTRCVFHFSMN